MGEKWIDERDVSIIVWTRICFGVEAVPGELEGKRKLLLCTQWKTVKTNLDRFCCVHGTTVCQTSLLMLNLKQDTKPFITITVGLVCTRSATAVLLSDLFVPVTNQVRWVWRSA